MSHFLPYALLQRTALLLILCMVLLSSGCGRYPTAVQQEYLSEQADTLVEETDFDCSYFYFLWGRHAELLLQFEEALEAYEKALICDPDTELISKKIPILLLRLERTDEAVEWLTNYLATRPDETGMRMLLAKVHVRQKEYARAISQYQEISTRNPEDPLPMLLLAELYLSSNMKENARKILEKVLKLDRSSYPAHRLLGRLYKLEKDIKKSLVHYKKALELNWSSELQLEIGELYSSAGEFEKAIIVYRQTLEKDKYNESARIALVQIYLLQEKDDLALVELQKLSAISAEPQRLFFALAKLYARNKKFGKGISVLQELLKKEGLLKKEELSEARFFLSILFFQTEQYEEALLELQQIDQVAEEYLDALFLQTRIFRLQQRFDAAIQLLEQNIRQPEIRNIDMFILLATLYQLQGQEDRSKLAYSQGFALYPDNDTLLYEYGLFLENSGDHAGAIEVMLRVITLNKDHAAALNFVGYTWADENVNLDQALELIQHAVQLKPDNGFVRDSLGWIYFRLGRLGKAAEELQEAIRLSPDDPAIFDHLGDVYFATGLLGKAKAAYSKALELYPGEEDRVVMEKKIQALLEEGESP